MDPKPYPEPSVNNYYGKQRLWNAIPSKVGLINKKTEEWGYPDHAPPPRGLRQSPQYFPFFFEKYFPDVHAVLVIDSVLNSETTKPIFQFPCSMSKREISNYLTQLYGLDNIVQVHVRNHRGKFFKNELGIIKTLPDYKEAVVVLDTPVRVDLKVVKATEDVGATPGKT